MTRSRMHADFLFPLQWAWLSEYEYFIGYNQWIWCVARQLCRIESQVAIWGRYLRLPNSCLKSNSPSRENDYKSSWRGHKHLDLMTLTQLLLGIKEVGFILRGPWMSVSSFNDNLSNSCREILYMYCKWWTKQPNTAFCIAMLSYTVTTSPYRLGTTVILYVTEWKNNNQKIQLVWFEHKWTEEWRKEQWVFVCITVSNGSGKKSIQINLSFLLTDDVKSLNLLTFCLWQHKKQTNKKSS